MIPPDIPKKDESDILAAEYVLGTLPLADRAAVETRIRRDAHFALAVTAWENRLAALNDSYHDAPAPDLFPKIEAGSLLIEAHRQRAVPQQVRLHALHGGQILAVGGEFLSDPALYIQQVSRHQKGPRRREIKPYRAARTPLLVRDPQQAQTLRLLHPVMHPPQRKPQPPGRPTHCFWVDGKGGQILRRVREKPRRLCRVQGHFCLLHTTQASALPSKLAAF